jgi:hypothetical protein
MDTTNRKAIRCFVASAAIGLLLATTAACADENDGDGGGPAPAAGSGEVTMEVLTPGDGDTVTVPFDVSVDTDVTLGPVADEMHHLHVWFGDDQTDFDLYMSETAHITSAPNGETTMWVQVHTFDHQPASEPVGVIVTIEGGNDNGGRSGPYDY